MLIKKKVVIPLLIIIFFITTIVFYNFYIADPNPFPTNEQLVEALNELFPEANVAEIQDAIFLDEKHVFVPFISKQNKYGGSYWAWRMNKWQIFSINTTGGTHIWQIDKSEPSSYHIIWNIDPKDNLKYIRFFLIRDRNFHVSNDIETYYPKIQMEKTVSLTDSSFGVLPLPEKWTSFINDLEDVESTKQSNSFFYNYFPMQQMYFGWIPYDFTNNVVFPEHSVNGGSYNNAKVNTDFVRILNESELERK